MATPTESSDTSDLDVESNMQANDLDVEIVIADVNPIEEMVDTGESRQEAHQSVLDSPDRVQSCRSCGGAISPTSPTISPQQEISRLSTDTIEENINQANMKSPNANSKGHRSTMRPFLCCGSELSLASLADGVDNVKIGAIGLSEEDMLVTSKSPCKPVDGVLVKGTASAVGHSLTRRKKKDKQSGKRRFTSLRFRTRWSPRLRVSQPSRHQTHQVGGTAGCQGTYQQVESPQTTSSLLRPLSSSSRLIDLSSVQDFDRLYPVEDLHDVGVRQRTQEINAGIEVDANILTRNIEPRVVVGDPCRCRRSSAVESLLSAEDMDYSSMHPSIRSMLSNPDQPRVHTQVDFIHCLMPDLVNIMSCPFYWGVMDRYEAERLLDNKPEGTFLLRDSAQEDFLYSVSFRRYGRSLHARVEQWNHRFSFDAHDPAVFSAPTVCKLMEHYKDPSLCMFFEPMLTRPLPRSHVFSLKHICRSVICDRLVYDQIRLLPLPNSLKQFLQVYHYKQKVRSRRFDVALPYADTNLVM